MTDKTCIFYTSNRENEMFERKITDNLLETIGDLPLISVSQKPMILGTNICVGDVGCSYLNEFRQIYVGCKAAKTDFVIMAEADCLYPPQGYFDYKPKDKETIYSYGNVWILTTKGNHYYKKDRTHGSLIYGRKLLMELIGDALAYKPMWSGKKVWFNLYPDNLLWQSFYSAEAIINVKTGNGINGTNTKWNRMVEPKDDLPYWGNIQLLKQRLFD